MKTVLATFLATLTAIVSFAVIFLPISYGIYLGSLKLTPFILLLTILVTPVAAFISMKCGTFFLHTARTAKGAPLFITSLMVFCCTIAGVALPDFLQNKLKENGVTEVISEGAMFLLMLFIFIAATSLVAYVASHGKKKEQANA